MVIVGLNLVMKSLNIMVIFLVEKKKVLHLI